LGVKFQLMMQGGLVIPPHLETPHAVSFVLTQKPGHLRMKNIQRGVFVCVRE